MTGIFTDTERVFKELVSKGFTEEQASAVVEAIRSLELSQFATKSDLEVAISELRSSMEKSFTELHSDNKVIRSEIGKLRLELIVGATAMVAGVMAIFKYVLPGGL